MDGLTNSLPAEDTRTSNTEIPVALTLDDLLASNSEVLQQIARNVDQGRRNITASHNSGHHSGQGHNSGAKVERPLSE
jgi:hypothetical protein